jgi:hypothetical protein
MILFLLWAVLAIAIFTVALYRKTPKEPHEREWGSGKDLSSLLPIKEVTALEDWWNANQSKDAQIRRLSEENKRLRFQLETQSFLDTVQQINKENNPEHTSFLDAIRKSDRDYSRYVYQKDAMGYTYIDREFDVW